MKNFGDLNPNERIQSICYSPNKMDHHVWPIEKLINPLLLKCRGVVWLKMIDQIVQPTLSLSPFMICVGLLLFLGCKNVVLKRPKYILTL